KTVASIFPRHMGRLHLNLPQSAARLHNKIVRIAVAPRLCHSESQLGRLCQKLRLRYLPAPLPSDRPCGVGTLVRVRPDRPNIRPATKIPKMGKPLCWPPRLCLLRRSTRQRRARVENVARAPSPAISDLWEGTLLPAKIA